MRKQIFKKKRRKKYISPLMSLLPANATFLLANVITCCRSVPRYQRGNILPNFLFIMFAYPRNLPNISLTVSLTLSLSLYLSHLISRKLDSR